ncbi:AMP-binding protein [Corallincola platygyrae]|uniref:AMP-binding protein n=1 Tax=Corallincola platygyrae TaxID=1193278 RepID=A0ABW4XKX1_9GAMM
MRAVNALGLDLVLLPNHQPKTIDAHQGQFDLILTDVLDFPTINKQVLFIELTDTYSQAYQPVFGWQASNIVMYTSGSTGEPKAIHKRLSQLIEEVDALGELFCPTDAGSAVISTVSHQHIYGLLFRILWPLRSGQAFCRENIEFQEQLKELRCSDKSFSSYTLISSPAFLKHLQQGDGALAELSHVFSSGGPLSVKHAAKARDILGCRVTEVLGSTETGGIAWRQQKVGSVLWQPLPGVKVDICDAGNLVVTSPYAGGTHYSQDKIELHENGLFDHKGRADRIVKVAEKRLSLAELEAFAEQSFLVKEAAAVLVTRGRRECVGLAVSLSPEGHRLLLEQGRRHCNLEINSYLITRFERVLLPRFFRYCDCIPVNSQGKRVQTALNALFLEKEE